LEGGCEITVALQSVKLNFLLSMLEMPFVLDAHETDGVKDDLATAKLFDYLEKDVSALFV